MNDFINATVGTPYDIHNRSGVSCWGLVAKYYHANGFILKDYRVDELSMREINRVFTQAFRDGDHGFAMTTTPHNADVIVLKSKHQTHCGLFVDGKIYHSSVATGGVSLQTLTDVKNTGGFTTIEYWTYDNN